MKKFKRTVLILVLLLFGLSHAQAKTTLKVDFGPTDGIWERNDDGSWEQLHGLSPEMMIEGDIDCNGRDDLIVDFGPADGIWVRYDDGSWEQLHGLSPEIMVVGDIDGNGCDDLIVDFGDTYGIWVRYDDGSWEQLHGLSPEIMIVGDIDCNGLDDLIVDFGDTYGIWVRYDDGSWEQLHGLSPEIMVVGDIDGNGCDDLIVDFGDTYGIWVRYDDGSWEQLHGLSPEIMIVGDIDCNGLDDLIVDFGDTYGIWVRYDDGSWEQLHGLSPEIMIVGDIDGNGCDDLIVDFGDIYGIWVRYDDGSWEQLHGLSPETMIVGIEINFITATAGTNGSITPSGTVEADDGSDQEFTITPDTNYHVSDVLVDGVSIGAVTTYTFINVTDDHTIEAIFAIDHIFVTMGESITGGTGDDDPSDDTSQDGRNTGGGYQPILNDLLTAFENGIPHDIVRAVSASTSAEGLALIQTILTQYPEAQRYLVMYGSADSRPTSFVPSGKGLNLGDPGYSGSYKDNMQQIIDAINSAGKEVCLAKLPIALGDFTTSTPYPDPDTGARSVNIKEYNEVIDELVSDPQNNITVTPPDFYNYFKANDPATGNPRYADQYSDNLHPNGIGYQSMADLWFDALTAP